MSYGAIRLELVSKKRVVERSGHGGADTAAVFPKLNIFRQRQIK